MHWLIEPQATARPFDDRHNVGTVCLPAESTRQVEDASLAAQGRPRRTSPARARLPHKLKYAGDRTRSRACRPFGTSTICAICWNIRSRRLIFDRTLVPSCLYCHTASMNFYAPPPVLSAELYLRIPDECRCTGQPSEWRGGFARPFQHIFLEGPVADSQGNLYVVDIPYGRLLRISPEKDVCVCASWDGEPNGLAATSGGTLLVADYKNVSVKSS